MLVLSLAIWPVMIGVPAFLVAWAAAALLARLRAVAAKLDDTQADSSGSGARPPG